MLVVVALAPRFGKFRLTITDHVESRGSVASWITRITYSRLVSKRLVVLDRRWTVCIVMGGLRYPTDFFHDLCQVIMRTRVGWDQLNGVPQRVHRFVRSDKVRIDISQVVPGFRKAWVAFDRLLIAGGRFGDLLQFTKYVTEVEVKQ